MKISYDHKKSLTNLKKHGISFNEAETALFDENALVIEDYDHQEQRFVLIGMSSSARIIVVVYAIWDQENEVIRLISARKATLKEETDYAN